MRRGGASRHEGREGGEELLAVVGAYFQDDGLVEVKAEDAQYGFGVHDVFAAFQGEVEVATRGDVDKLFDCFGGVELDLYGFHGGALLSKILFNVIISHSTHICKGI